MSLPDGKWDDPDRYRDLIPRPIKTGEGGYTPNYILATVLAIARRLEYMPKTGTPEILKPGNREREPGEEG